MLSMATSNVSKLFDHAVHNGSNYLNGHCFVSVMLCVPGMILHLHRPVVGAVLPNMENIFLLKQILRFPMKRLVIIIPVSSGFSLRSSATGKSLPMSLPQKKNMVQNDCFSVPFSRKICRFSVHGRKKHH